jgi:hypothetical protein
MPATSFRLVVALLVASPLLASCSSDFDPGDVAEKLDFFHLNEKKKLPGERKELFPGGVPGVTQGIPPDLVKGYQPPPTVAAEEPEQKAEPQKPKPKPHVAHRAPPKQKPAQAKQAPQEQQPPQTQAQQQQSGTQTPWPAPQTQSSPWPTAPAPNTFQR